MFVAGKQPGDCSQIHTVFVLEDGARPYPCCDGITSMDAYSLAFEIFGHSNPGFPVVKNGSVMKHASRENRKSREGLSMSFGAEIRRERQLTHVKLQVSNHPAECLDQDGDIFVFKFKTLWSDAAVLEKPGVPERAENRF